MSSERFDDELLSAIIDGDADEATVASVLADETASQRLEAMRTVAGIVAEEPAPATAARREQSIAAALAAAKPAPEVTSLTTERVARRSGPSPKILAIAAAVLLFIIAIPVIAGIRSGSVETAATDTAAEASTELRASDDAADVVEDAVDGDDDEAMEDEEEAMEDDEAMEDGEVDVPAAVQSPESTDDAGDAGADAADAEEEFAPVTERSLAERLDARPPAVSASESLIGIDDLIQLGSVFPQYTLDELLDAGVNPDCVDQDSTAVGFDVVLLDDESRLVIVEFFDDETTRLLDAEDCSVLR